ncbi:hypothetical protein [Pseudomonas sp.]|uniref:hypothetical protein n=1 Tax=Pseudomonas sp. TaxID=306 RepID=UPI003265D9FA
MQLHEVEEVKSVSTTSAANQSLAEGWTLIAVVSDSGGGARYVFGKSEQAPKAPMSISAAALAKANERL